MASTQREIVSFTENQTACLLGWSGLIDVLVEPDKEPRKVLLQTDFSIAKTKCPDLLFQTTKQMKRTAQNFIWYEEWI